MTGTLELIRHYAGELPELAKFAIFMAIIVCVPPLFKRMKLPALVGLILAGIVIGPHGIELLGKHKPVADFAAELGKLLLMFFCGLEIDLALFKRVRGKSIKFGLVTTLTPLVLGTVVGLLFGYAVIPSIVLGSLLASHTLLANPIINELGANKLEPVTVTVGATVFSDTLSLIIFAICVSTYQSGFSLGGLAVQLLQIAVFFPLILFGVSGLGAYLLKKVENDENAYFLIMLAILAVSGLLASAINLPHIVGAFLAGLAVNASVHDKPAKEKLEFFGNSMFIPIFFIAIGFLIDPVVFVQSIRNNLLLAIAIIVALLLGKWIAAQTTGRAFGYSPEARITVWSLTLPQVAATLAAALAAYATMNPQGQRLVDEHLLNVILVLVLTTSILGPVLTQRFAPRMLEEEDRTRISPAA